MAEGAGDRRNAGGVGKIWGIGRRRWISSWRLLSGYVRFYVRCQQLFSTVSPESDGE